MIVSLDGEPISSEMLEGAPTVGKIIDRVKALLQGRGAIIFSIVCDGEEIPARSIKAVLAEPAGKFNRLDLTSGRPREVVLAVLEETRRSFGDTFAATKQAAEDMSSGKTDEGLNILIDCVGVWANVHEAIVQGGALVGIDFDRLVIDSRHILDWLKDLNTKLREIKDAVKSKDHVLLADILRYEMDETLLGWEQMVDGFISRIKTVNEPANSQPQRPMATVG